ncbi:growth factor [Coprinopsis cinerea AmutBmut pab1-1]|nr:growth factor [Coprinopsis cinerea AmutBmut pab1-1]
MAVEATSTPSNGKPKTTLPPGMVMGPDGKPCKICTAFRNWKPGTTNHTEADTGRDKARAADYAAKAKAQAGASQNNSTRAAMGAFAGFAAAAANTSAKSTNSQDTTQTGSQSVEGTTQLSERPLEPPADCPPDVEVLGRATWTFLHTAAAYYPDKPTPTQRANMLMLLRSLPIVYPCSWCADDFGKSIDHNPPDVSSRERLSLWLCQRHNEVNEKLGKEKFDCSKVDERWKDGPPDGRCD